MKAGILKKDLMPGPPHFYISVEVASVRVAHSTEVS